LRRVVSPCHTRAQLRRMWRRAASNEARRPPQRTETCDIGNALASRAGRRPDVALAGQRPLSRGTSPAGGHATVYRHTDGCVANAPIPFRDHLLVACYDGNSLVKLDANRKQVRMIGVDSWRAIRLGAAAENLRTAHVI
jgi:hypothetical protein